VNTLDEYRSLSDRVFVASVATFEATEDWEVQDEIQKLDKVTFFGFVVITGIIDEQVLELVLEKSADFFEELLFTEEEGEEGVAFVDLEQ